MRYLGHTARLADVEGAVAEAASLAARRLNGADFCGRYVRRSGGVLVRPEASTLYTCMYRGYSFIMYYLVS